MRGGLKNLSGGSCRPQNWGFLGVAVVALSLSLFGSPGGGGSDHPKQGAGLGSCGSVPPRVCGGGLLVSVRSVVVPVVWLKTAAGLPSVRLSLWASSLCWGVCLSMIGRGVSSALSSWLGGCRCCWA